MITSKWYSTLPFYLVGNINSPQQTFRHVRLIKDISMSAFIVQKSVSSNVHAFEANFATDPMAKITITILLIFYN